MSERRPSVLDRLQRMPLQETAPCPSEAIWRVVECQMKCQKQSFVQPDTSKFVFEMLPCYVMVPF